MWEQGKRRERFLGAHHIACWPCSPSCIPSAACCTGWSGIPSPHWLMKPLAVAFPDRSKSNRRTHHAYLVPDLTLSCWLEKQSQLLAPTCPVMLASSLMDLTCPRMLSPVWMNMSLMAVSRQKLYHLTGLISVTPVDNSNDGSWTNLH